ncbi:MAG: hypothetical protein NVSMB51_19800 [Solirubrobacteraceae bacterium]
MPQMGVSVVEGTLTVWHKRVGDWVAEEETICEISTDKIDTELPAPAAGRIDRLLVAEGETVQVGAVLALIAADALPGQAHPDEHAPAPAGASLPDEAPRIRHYSPVVQRIAARHGVDLERVSGSGRGGRVRKADVLALLAASDGGRAEDAPPPAPGASSGPHRGDDSPPPLHSESPYRPDPAPAAAAFAEPLSRMRRSIGEHMLRSLRTAAHCTTIIEVDMGVVEALRRPLGLSPLPFVARACVDALRELPALNATLDGDLLTHHADVNLGVAVALGDEGLIVPVIDRAQELSVEGLARRIASLAARARAGELTADEVHGGTFTITNPGRHGTIAATPIINQPQVAILDIEAVVKRPVVTSSGGVDAIAIRPMANLCLSWDHRALDGVLAAKFLARVRTQLEGPAG